MTNTSNLDNVVRSVILDFVQGDKLFTGLDVSNEVKNLIPGARHSEVSGLVRQLFTTDIETAGYGRTPIDVTLGDGSKRTAMLYHPLSDSWDLDSKYDTQQRAKVAARPNAPAKVVSPATNAVVPTPIVVAPTPAPAPVVATVADARTQWDNLFKTQPSLFPRR
jgi:hypothetical protein